MNSSFLTKVQWQFSEEQINRCWKIRYSFDVKNELLFMCYTISKNPSRWIPEVNVKPKTIKGRENRRKSL